MRKLLFSTIILCLMPFLVYGGIEGTPTVVSTDNDYVPIWDYSADGTLKKVDASELRGAGGGAGNNTIIVKEDNSTVDANIDTLDFLGADFDLTEDPEDEVQIVIAPAIARDAELIGGSWASPGADIGTGTPVAGTFIAVTVTADPTPGYIGDDNDTTVETEDWKIYGNATDAGDGSEDVDIYLQTQINSVLTSVFQVDADGYFNILALDLNIAAGKKYRINGTQIGLSDLASKPITGLSATNWRVFYSAGGAIPVELALGVNGTYLRSNGVDQPPSFTTPAGGGDMLEATYDTDADGDIDQAAGGLEADVSAYTGLIGLNAGAVSEVDTKAELEGMMGDVANFAEADGDIYTGDIALDDDAAVEIDGTADGMADDSYNGVTLGGINAGSDIAEFALVVLSADGKYDEADADNALFPARGVAVECRGGGGWPCQDTEELIILVRGVVRNDGWPEALTPGDTLYLDDTADGTIDDNAPATANDCVQVVGWAISEDEVMFNISGHWLLVE